MNRLAPAKPAREHALEHGRGPLPPLFDASFVRSHLLYDEFVYRLTLAVARASASAGPRRARSST